MIYLDHNQQNQVLRDIGGKLVQMISTSRVTSRKITHIENKSKSWSLISLLMISLGYYPRRYIKISKDFTLRHFNWSRVWMRWCRKISDWKLRYRFCKKKRIRWIDISKLRLKVCQSRVTADWTFMVRKAMRYILCNWEIK